MVARNGINRNILECKSKTIFKKNQIIFSINRNILECKYISEDRKVVVKTMY